MLLAGSANLIAYFWPVFQIAATQSSDQLHEPAALRYRNQNGRLILDPASARCVVQAMSIIASVTHARHRVTGEISAAIGVVC